MQIHFMKYLHILLALASRRDILGMLKYHTQYLIDACSRALPSPCLYAVQLSRILEAVYPR